MAEALGIVPFNAGQIVDEMEGMVLLGLDGGVIGGGVMVWTVFTRTVAGPGFLAGDDVEVSGEGSVGAGLGANVLVGGSNRTVTLQPMSV